MVHENDYVARQAPRERGEAEREGSLGDKRVEEREMCKAFRSFYPPKRTQQDTKPL